MSKIKYTFKNENMIVVIGESEKARRSRMKTLISLVDQDISVEIGKDISGYIVERELFDKGEKYDS